MRTFTRMAAVAGAAFVTLAAATAFAGDLRPFETKAFEAAQRAGTAIVVDVWASWCPTCAAQEPIIEKLISSPEFSSVTVFKVDFDKQKEVVQALGAQRQSTLIAFKGASETARSVGDTDAASIEALFRSALKN
ncbi:thioredoxin family protein [Sinorhizobium arboris]|uniref:thioredoxin family protein n=1 Tax=Sinorhizobium arboris TaxID=76745 RepID=UPI000489F8DA|nr:thioredoxin family protein [Sinorhizobium arboris]